MDKKNIEALLSLLNDPDKDTFEAVVDSLTLDTDMIPVLENLWRQAEDETAISRLDQLIHQARFNQLEKWLMEWKEKKGELLEGAWLVATYQYPDLTFAEIDDAISGITKDVWLELHDEMTPAEQIAAINHMLYGKYNLKGDTQVVLSINNILINNVLRARKGNHLGLAILYICVAQKLNIPIYGVPMLPNFALAYLNDAALGENVVFYIDPFNEGKTFDEADVRNYLEEQQIFDREYILPCSHEVTIQLLVGGLMVLFEEKGMSRKAKDMNRILTKLRNTQS